MSSATRRASDLSRIPCRSSKRLTTKSGCWQMATVGRQLCQRSCIRPASRVVPNNPMTTIGFTSIAININYYPTSANTKDYGLDSTEYVMHYLVHSVIAGSVPSLHIISIEHTEKRASDGS